MSSDMSSSTATIDNPRSENQPDHATPSLIIGLTGGIGSGKSAAAAIFRKLGVKVVDADQVAREVVEPGSPALQAIAERHGPSILLENGMLDRAALRTIIFSQASEKDWLEQLTHPLIGDSIHRQLHAQQSDGEAPYRILESPLLMETQQKNFVQRLCLVDVDINTQIARVMERDNNDENQVKAIIAAQMPRTEKLERAHDIIDNSGSLAELSKQVHALHRKYCNIAENNRA